MAGSSEPKRDIWHIESLLHHSSFCAGRVLCPNVLNTKFGYWGRFTSKFQLFAFTLLGPEWALVIAGGELNSAYRAKKGFQSSRSLRLDFAPLLLCQHGWAQPGVPDREAAGESPFPIDCQQLLLLVENKYLMMLEITKDDIEDRNKSDSLARVITCVQSLWFTSDTLGRLGHGLAVSTLELTTLAFVFIMIACSVCWWQKPMDVSRPILLRVDVDFSTIHRETSAPIPLRGHLPLSYLNRQEWFMSQFWLYYMQILWSLTIVRGKQPVPGQATALASIGFPELDLRWEIVFAPLVAHYSAIFLVVWNFHFPTRTEQTLWRISSACTLTYGILADCVTGSYHQSQMLERCWLALLAFFKHKKNTGSLSKTNMTSDKQDKGGLGLWWTVKAACGRIRNLSPDQDPTLAIPLRWMVPATILNILYIVSRLYILTEDFAGLRSLPSSTFKTVNYGLYSPVL